MDIRHTFVSPVVDQANPGEVGPDEWNETHNPQMSTGKFLGRLTAGTGVVEELTLTAFGASLMGLADLAALAAALDPTFLTQAEADLLYAPIGGGSVAGDAPVIVYGAASGVDTITASPSGGTNTLRLFQAAGVNTGAATFNGKPIKQPDGSALVGGELQTGIAYLLLDDGTNCTIVGSNAVI